MESAVQDTLNPAQNSVPKVTRGVAGLLILATALAHAPGVGNAVVKNFALRPTATVGESKLWNVVTGGFLEIDPFDSLINVVLFLTMGKWIEASWGGRHLFVFLLLINTFSALCTNVLMFAAYVATRTGSFMFDPIGTTNGICVALLVAVKQLIPEHEIGFNGVTMKANYLPMVYVVFITIITIAQFSSMGVLVFTMAAFQTSWLYLRFLQTRNGERGDLSDAFAYATLFPQPLSRVVAVIANLFFIIFKPLLMVGQSTITNETEPEPPIPASKGSSVDAERRRQRALKALDERLNSSARAEETSDSLV